MLVFTTLQNPNPHLLKPGQFFVQISHKRSNMVNTFALGA